MKLYFSWLSPYSQKTLVGLYEKGADFTPEVVNLGDPAARAAYQKLYPLGKVPLLALDDGYLIPESTTILEYVDAHVAGGTKLIPADVDRGRRARFFDRQFDLYVNDPFGRIFFAGDAPGVPPTNPNEREVRRIESAKRTLGISYDFYDRHFEKNTWVLGDEFTLGDCSAVALLYAKNVMPFDRHPNLARYVGRLVERPSVARMLKEAAPHLPKREGK
jgi:glutathione S-transferase